MDSENKNIDISNILILISICISSIIFGIIGYITYNNSYDAFISFIGLIFLTYSSISLFYTFLKKKEYSNNEFNTNFGLDVSAIVISLMITIYFGIKSFFNKKKISVNSVNSVNYRRNY